MKKVVTLFVSFVLITFSVKGQRSDSLESKNWEFNASAYAYMIPDNFIFLPVIQANHSALHLEARYNYEDMNTLSAWAGYNFKGGKRIEYVITPMLGGIFGNSNGIAPGLEFDFTHKKFEWYSESEYFIDTKESANNFIYVWTDITYSPKDWIWFGISGQRTRLYETKLDIQRGFIIGAGQKNWEFEAYLYNLFFDDPFLILSFNLTF